MAIKNVVFDLGGVMINYNPAAFIRDMGYDEETCQAVLNAIFYDPVWEDMDMGKYMTYTDALPEFIKRHPDLETPIREFFQPDWMKVYTVKEETERELYDWVHEKALTSTSSPTMLQMDLLTSATNIRSSRKAAAMLSRLLRNA